MRRTLVAFAVAAVSAITAIGALVTGPIEPTMVELKEESLLKDWQNLEPLFGWAASAKVALIRHGQPLLIQYKIEIWKDGKLVAPVEWEGGFVFDKPSEDLSAGAISMCILQKDVGFEVRSVYNCSGSSVVGVPMHFNLNLPAIQNGGRLAPISSMAVQPRPIQLGNEAIANVFMLRDSENQKHGIPLGSTTFDPSDTRLYRVAVVLKVRARIP